MEVFAGRRGVSKLKLNRLTFLDDIAYGETARLLIGADKVADEKIPSLEVILVFVDDDA